jgi:hypothetical protein
MPLPSLNPLPGLNLNSLGDFASSVANVATGGTVGTGPIPNQNNPAPASSSPTVTKYVTIILGLLLIAAGIFSFDKTRELVVSAGKKAGAVGTL